MLIMIVICLFSGLSIFVDKFNVSISKYTLTLEIFLVIANYLISTSQKYVVSDIYGPSITDEVFMSAAKFKLILKNLKTIIILFEMQL